MLGSRPSAGEGRGGVGEDTDFKLNPWLCALDFIEGTRPSARHSPINAINASRIAHRVEQVAGIVSSCRPNGLGSLFVTLKDRTGTIGAFIHHKVLMDQRFGSGELVVGCVLILKKVVAFPVRASIYLNVTLNNMAKLIKKDSGPPQRSSIKLFTSGKETAIRNVPENPTISRPRGEKFANVSSCRKHLSSGSAASDETFLVTEPAKKATPEVAASQVSNDRRTGINFRQQANERSACTSSISDATTPQLDEARIVALMAEAERSPRKQVTTSSTWIDPNSTIEPGGRSSSGDRACFVTACDARPTVAASKRRHGAEESHTEDDIGEVSSMPENCKKTAKGPSGSLPSGMVGVATSSFATPEASAKVEDHEAITSKASITGWTDEQIQELFCDYQEVDDMFLM